MCEIVEKNQRRFEGVFDIRFPRMISVFCCINFEVHAVTHDTMF